MPAILKLPVDEVLPDVLAALRMTGSVVLQAPTGAGKTTRVPPAIRDSGIAGSGQIIMLQPRRIAARAAGYRMAAERGVKIGTEVGYQVRFDERSSSETKILVVTEGILLRRLQEDPFLDGVSTVIFDEFHERSLNSDLALGMLKRIRQTVRNDVQIVVMSATLDAEPVAAYLDNAPTITCTGRAFPVDIRYATPPGRRGIPELAAWGVQQALKATSGDLLVFLPGVGEIHRTERELEGIARRDDFALMTLYGNLPPEEQDRVLLPVDRRKVVLSTNVAQTSLTIEGITGVVDTGCARVMRYDPGAGLDRLELEPISQAAADQRSGRAGRTQAGYCLRLWDEVSQRHRPRQDEPEVHRVDLAGPVLLLKSWGEQDMFAFPWFEAPKQEAIDQAIVLLKRLGALDAQEQVTPDGNLMAQLPVHPRLARLILEGHRQGESRAVCWLAAMISERDPFFRSGRPGSGGAGVTVSHHSRSDVLDRLSGLEEFARSGQEQFPWGIVNRSAARQIVQVRDQLEGAVKALQPAGKSSPGLRGEEVLLKSLVAAFPDRVAKRRDTGSDRGLMVGGKGVKLAAQSSVRGGSMFLCVDVDAGTGGTGDALVRQASAVELEWLPSTSLRTSTDLFFHPSQKQVVARQRNYFEDLILSETPTSLPAGHAAAELLYQEAVKAWEQVFPGDDPEVSGLVARVQCLSNWMPELELPSLDQQSLHKVLLSLCSSCRSFSELKKCDWRSAILEALTWPQRQTLEREAPEKLTVPSGSQIRLEYEVSRPPVLAVRIQELFGLTSSPRIAGGRVKVLLHLLAPNYRPQQVTDDLESFWKNTYPVVRRELARRYPKHPWPEDPLTAKAIRK